MDYSKLDHRFQNTWNARKKEKPNSQRSHPTISFRTNDLDQETLNHLLRLKKTGKMSEFICNSVKTKYMINSNPGAFIYNFIEENFYLIKKMLRRVGREKTKYKAKDNNK